MTDDRRMTTDRFYGGVSDRLENLRSMLSYIRDENPSRDELNQWVIDNTRAGSPDAVSHHLTFLDSIEIIELPEDRCRVGEYGKEWLVDQNPKVLYEALTSGVKGFSTVLRELQEGAMTDEEIMNLLVREFEEAEMSKPGPAVRHREWLQVLGYVEREDGVNRLTKEGDELAESTGEKTSSEVSSWGTNTEDEMKHREDVGGLSWLEAVRQELERYRETHNETVVTLGEVYDFSKERLDSWFPKNDNVRAKIRQQLQLLRDRDELEFLDEQGTYQIKTGDEVRQQKTKLERELSSEPKLTEDSEEFRDTKRRVRNQAFAELVKEAYGQACAFCGSSRETPNGNPEVEAAHIYPKEKEGRDDLRNGIALCKLHHWAFDTGWLSISDECKILVKDAPERNGYHEFKQLEGKPVQLPDEEKAEPSPIFLEEHRCLHGFE